MSENLENRISSTQAKDAIYKAHSISSSASEIDNSLRCIETRTDITKRRNDISNRAINILGDSICSDYRSYGAAIKMAFNLLTGSNNFGFPHKGYGFDSDELNVLSNAGAVNSLNGRFVVVEPSASCDMEEFRPAYQYFNNGEKVRIFYDNTQIGYTFKIDFLNISGSVLSTSNFTTTSLGVTSFITAPLGSVKIVLTNTHTLALKVENPQIVTNENDYTVNVMAQPGRALSYITYDVIDRWFNNAEYAILGLNTNDLQGNAAFEDKISYIESKYNDNSNLITKLVIIDLSSDYSLHSNVVERLKVMQKNCKGSILISLREIYGTDDVDEMINLGLINIDRVHPVVPFGQNELANGILKKLGISLTKQFLDSDKDKNNPLSIKVAGVMLSNGNQKEVTNIHIGESSGFYNTTAKKDTFIGYQAAFRLENGENNTGLGYRAGYGNVSGNDNTFMGSEAGHSTKGSGNTFVGKKAGFSMATNHYNTYIGEQAGNLKQDGTPNDSSSFTVCLGKDSRVSGSNQVQLGGSTTTTYAYGAVQDRSDIRDKADIENTPLGLEFISKVNPVQYRWDYRDDYNEVQEDGTILSLDKDGSRKRNRLHQGVIAQQVKEVIDELGIDFGGFQDHSLSGGCDVMSIGYQEFIPPLIKAIQELKNRLEILEKE